MDPTAKRSPSILVTDTRNKHSSAPFAGLNRRKGSVPNPAERYISDQKHFNTNVLPQRNARIPLRARAMPKLNKTLPTRTSKTTEKLVLIPEQESKEPRQDYIDQNVNDERSRAERMPKEFRQAEFPRVTAYLISEQFDMRLMAKFLSKAHLVSPRLYDEVLYVPYSLPLLPGMNGHRIQSNNSEKLLPGKKLMESFINTTEQKDHHFEYFSGQNLEEGGYPTLDGAQPSSAEFDPSEPQLFETAAVVDRPATAASQTPDLTKYAEMFVFEYGVVVFWNFTEVHEKNILADLTFAKLYAEEFQDDDEDEEEDWPFEPSKQEEDPFSLLLKPIHEQDIETEEFHFEYNNQISTPRIYNDMITLKSGDHLIKLTISHSIAQSTKLCLFESKMSHILNNVTKLPKLLALTGSLGSYNRSRLLMKTGKFFRLRNEVNLLSNVLDTPDFFWSLEPALHPLYSAIREYLEIDQRVEVINDRCKVFLDFFDIVANSIAEKNMNRITIMIIWVIGFGVIVSTAEIFIRYLIISKWR